MAIAKPHDEVSDWPQQRADYCIEYAILNDCENVDKGNR